MHKNFIFGIRTRFFLTFLLTSSALVLAMFLVFRLSFDRGLSKYIQLAEKQRLEQLAGVIAQAYVKQNGFDFLRVSPIAFMAIIHEARNDQPYHHDISDEDDTDRDLLESREHHSGDKQHFEDRLILLDANHNLLWGQARSWPDSTPFVTLKAHGKTIGQLGLLPVPIIVDGLVRLFAEGQHQALKLISLSMAVCMAILSIILAHLLVRRISVLTSVVSQLVSGQYDIQIPVQSRDELGKLAGDINILAQTLAHNKQDRRRWVADISHELRTPLAVLRAEIEAVQDGVRQLTPQTFASLHTNVRHLGRLVEDLYQLARGDNGALAYRKERLDLLEITKQVVESFQSQFISYGISLKYTADDQSLWVLGDTQRLRQLIDNLLNNSLRYTDPGGEVHLTLRRDSGKIVLTFDDSAPGVPDEALPHLFERLYRVEASRSRAHGGSGLGLSLCKAIVEAHKGAITAQASSLGGLKIEIILPEKDCICSS